MERCKCDECEAVDFAPEELTYEDGLAEMARVKRDEGESPNFDMLLDAMCANWGISSAGIRAEVDDA